MPTGVWHWVDDTVWLEWKSCVAFGNIEQWVERELCAGYYDLQKDFDDVQQDCLTLVEGVVGKVGHWVEEGFAEVPLDPNARILMCAARVQLVACDAAEPELAGRETAGAPREHANQESGLQSAPGIEGFGDQTPPSMP